MIVFAADPVKFNNCMAEAIKKEYELLFNKEVKIEPIYEEGYKFGAKALGPRNYRKVKYQTIIDSQEPLIIDADIDLRLWSGESRYNYRLLFTPAEEREKGVINKLFFTPENKDTHSGNLKNCIKLSDRPYIYENVIKRIMNEIPSSDLRVYDNSGQIYTLKD